jgi:hypothetical protein
MRQAIAAHLPAPDALHHVLLAKEQDETEGAPAGLLPEQRLAVLERLQGLREQLAAEAFDARNAFAQLQGQCAGYVSEALEPLQVAMAPLNDRLALPQLTAFGTEVPVRNDRLLATPISDSKRLIPAVRQPLQRAQCRMQPHTETDCWCFPIAPSPQASCAQECAENSASINKALMHPSAPHADLIAAFRRAEADAAHKSGLIQLVAKKGPRAIQTAMETAAKAEKRRDSFAKKLKALGVTLTD